MDIRNESPRAEMLLRDVALKQPRFQAGLGGIMATMLGLDMFRQFIEPNSATMRGRLDLA